MDRIDEGLWEAHRELMMPGGIWFDARMTVVDVGDGELLLHSPVPIDDAMASEIEEHGDVRWIVAPNDMHNSWIEGAAERFASAEVWGSPGTVKKKSSVDFDGVLDGRTPDGWNDRIDSVFVDGTRGWAESVFYLPKQRTLLCSDLVFNIHETKNLRTKWLLTLVGAYGKLAQSGSVRFWFAKDNQAVGRSFADMLRWDFDRVVMAHGRVVEQDGKELIAPSLAWALPHERLTLPAGE